MSRPHSILQPRDVVAVIDTREQLPLPLELPSIRGTLATGDYSVRGLEPYICVERKSLADFVMCVSRERERFERELQRMRAYETRVIVVEASLAQVEAQEYRAQVSPAAVLGSHYGWIARGITIEWAGDRAKAAKAVSRILFSAARERFRQLGAFYDGLRLAPTAEKEGA